MPKTLTASGPAMLHFPDGRKVSVNASLTVNRSFFSLSGEGEFTTDDDTASHAFLSGEPLSITVGETASAEIIVSEAKTMQATTLCRFRVHS